MRGIVTGLGMLLFIGVVIVAASTLRSHADFFSFSAANDSAKAVQTLERIEKRQQLIVTILCEDNKTYTNVTSKACKEAEGLR